MPGGDLPSNAPRPGDVIGRDYRVEGLLGTGGMGFVLAATRLSNGERVAIKMLLPHVAGLPDVVARFMREARSASAIDNVHSTRVFEVGETDEGAPFMVMEHLDGTDLKTILRREKRIPAARAVDWILQACDGISAAHRRKIVHRDLKPANLFLASTPSGPVIKVLDFGISKSLVADTDEPLHLTQTSEMLGSPYYMSPEQIKSSRYVDERGDIWALGVILHELLTGSLPFKAPTLAELCVLILTTPASRIDEHGEYPHGLADVVATCLRAEPRDRWQRVEDLATALGPFASGSVKPSAPRNATVRMPRASEPDLDLQQTVRLESSPSLRPIVPSAERTPAPPRPPMGSGLDRSATGFAQTASAPRAPGVGSIAIAIAIVLAAGGAAVAAIVWKSKPEPTVSPAPVESASAPASAPASASASASASAPASAFASASASASASTFASASAAPVSSAKPRGKPPPKKGLFGSEH